MSVELDIQLKDMQFIAALLRGAGAQKEWTEEVKRTKKATDDAEKSLDRMAAHVQRMHATPLEKYNREVQKLDQLLAKAKISQDLHARATAAAKMQYDQAANSAQKLRSTGLDAGMDVAGSLGMVTTAGAAAAMAVQQIGESFRFAQEQARKAADEMDKLFAARRTLNQVATSPEHLQKMIDQADAGAEKYGVSREVAHSIMADAVGVGFESEYDTILGAHAGAVNAHDATRMAKKTLAIYRAKDPTLTAKSAIDMTLAAAKPSELSFEDLASGVAQASEGGAVVGSSAEETISMLSVLGGKFASVQTAADRMKGFSARAGTNDRLKGKGTLGAFRTLRDEFSDEERKKFLGDSQELNIMYQMLLENEGAIVERQGLVTAARTASDAGQGEVSQALARAGKTPSLSSTIKKQRAEVGLQIAQEKTLGVYGQDQQAGLALAQRQQLERGDNVFERFAGYRAAQAASLFGVSGDYLPAAASFGVGLVGGTNYIGGGQQQAPASQPAADLQLEAAAALNKSAQNIEAATRKKPPIHPAAQVEAAAAIT